MNNYEQLPDPPVALGAVEILQRLIDSIGFRYQLATQNLSDDAINFRPIEGSMSMMEVLDHIYKLLFWSYRSFNPDAVPNRSLVTFQQLRSETLSLCAQQVRWLAQVTPDQLEKTQIHLKRMGTTHSFWYIINGPLTDALTHIGQINSWRRMAGDPCPRISPFTGEEY